jgi:hypothetical protein
MKLLRVLVCGAMTFAASIASAASGEMGTGVPNFGVFGQAAGSYIAVWSLSNISIPQPSGCTTLYLYPATMGLDAYKMSMAILTAAKLSGARVRFYAHADRDGGCGVDYVGLDG